MPRNSLLSRVVAVVITLVVEHSAIGNAQAVEVIGECGPTTEIQLDAPDGVLTITVPTNYLPKRLSRVPEDPIMTMHLEVAWPDVFRSSDAPRNVDATMPILITTERAFLKRRAPVYEMPNGWGLAYCGRPLPSDKTWGVGPYVFRSADAPTDIAKLSPRKCPMTTQSISEIDGTPGRMYSDRFQRKLIVSRRTYGSSKYRLTQEVAGNTEPKPMRVHDAKYHQHRDARGYVQAVSVRYEGPISPDSRMRGIRAPETCAQCRLYYAQQGNLLFATRNLPLYQGLYGLDPRYYDPVESIHWNDRNWTAEDVFPQRGNSENETSDEFAMNFAKFVSQCIH